MNPLQLSAYTLVNALGRGIDASWSALQESRSGLRPCDFPDTPLTTWIGRVDGLEEEAITGNLAHFDCRNNRLAQVALQQDDFLAAVAKARTQYGPTRMGTFVGTSTSGVQHTEQAYRRCDPVTGKLPDDFLYDYTQNMFAITDFVRQYLALEGPSLTVSTACCSSAKVFATASRYIQAGLCDAAVVGGVDSLCQTTLYGFNALELVATYPCRPWDRDRRGISVGEAAGFALLERIPMGGSRGIALLGYGESNDAYHLSTPHPDGKGAMLAMQRALASAQLTPNQVDYINLHGTASRANDLAEDKAVTTVFGTQTPCSSTKGWTGHTLGAAGITEAILVSLCLLHNFLPRSLNTETVDSQLSARILLESFEPSSPSRYAMSNSFGFGGNNCSLILSRLI
ncbi:MAG: beta-ketoacyl-[acyl-carrier-protein] synthase II [Beggiatoa sp. IS2]|nr:MAG: beta-ketoacyl-[acyl-carrier-protein] synthase II [Beggiatoa sp. IS2]